MDADRKEILSIQGPVCFCQGICCPGDIEFVVSICVVSTTISGYGRVKAFPPILFTFYPNDLERNLSIR